VSLLRRLIFVMTSMAITILVVYCTPHSYVAFQLITALHYVHSNNILHGDITPANVMFQPASLLSSSSGMEGGGGEIPRVDLLYEKKRREGNITITLLQAPVVNYQRRSRDGQSEKSAGSYADRAASATVSESEDKTVNSERPPVAGHDLIEDIGLAEMREYLGEFQHGIMLSLTINSVI
jgi:serine/threonine protein kinase